MKAEEAKTKAKAGRPLSHAEQVGGFSYTLAANIFEERAIEAQAEPTAVSENAARRDGPHTAR